MNLAVLGAAGRTGRHVVEQAMARGYRVTAFTRRPAALADCAGLAAVVPGDGRDPRPTAITRADAGRVLLDITEDQALARTAVNIAGPARKGTP